MALAREGDRQTGAAFDADGQVLVPQLFGVETVDVDGGGKRSLCARSVKARR